MTMRRLIILLLILPFVTVGQKYVVSNGKYVKINGKYVRDAEIPPIVYDDDFLAFFARTTGTPDTWKDAYNQLFLDLKAAGIYDKLDVMYIFAAHNSSDALLNIVGNSSNATAVNSPTFTAKVGYQSNGSSSYINSNYNVMANGVHYTLNDASAGVYSTGTATVGTSQTPFGTFYNSTCLPLCELFGDGRFLGGINNSPYTLASFTGSFTKIIGLTRDNASTCKLYANGSSTQYTLSSGYPSESMNVYILARNNNGSADVFYGQPISLFWAGGSLDDTQMQSMEVIIESFLTSIATL